MEKDKAIIVSSSKETISLTKKQLETALFNIAGEFVSGNEALRKATILLPDIVIADYNLSDMTGLDFAKSIELLHICPVIILANKSQSQYIDEIKKDALDIFCLTKPINEIILNHTVSLAIKLSKEISKYQSAITDLKQELENRKLIEKAKGILMNKFDLSENEAYSQLRKKAMDSSKSIEQIAKTIIDMFNLFE
jgi:response regulator NasT